MVCIGVFGQQSPYRTQFYSDPDNQLEYTDITAADCDHIIPTNKYEWIGTANNVQPGDIIGIPGGSRGGMRLRGIIGTEANPVIIINCDGQADISGNSNGFEILESEHFILTGTGSTNPDHRYGIKVYGYQGLNIRYRSTNFEVRGVEASAGYAGIRALSDAACDGSVSKDNFTQYNTIIHHNYVHDTGGEGMYIGGSHWGGGQRAQPGCEGTLIFEPVLKECESTGILL